MADIMVLVGGQYGSEGKGVIAAHMANRFQVHVRTGGPNAGHSFYDKRGKLWKMQAVPCGFINESARLVIGRGAVVDLETLLQEIWLIEKDYGSLVGRLFVDRNAIILHPSHADEEGGIDGAGHKNMGSTGKGVGAARIHRMIRQIHGESELAPAMDQMGEMWTRISPYVHEDTVALLDDLRRQDQNILLEGTQGSGLSLIHGDWPYVTSGETNAAGFAAEAGIPPTAVTRVMMVLRTYPIRVAGNSGPLFQEIDFDLISTRMGRKTVEKTTVTKKVRRIGRWDEQLALRSARLNGPTDIAITFMDYLAPECEGETKRANLPARAQAFIQYVETLLEAPVTLVGTGGKGWQVCE